MADTHNTTLVRRGFLQALIAAAAALALSVPAAMWLTSTSSGGSRTEPFAAAVRTAATALWDGPAESGAYAATHQLRVASTSSASPSPLPPFENAVTQLSIPSVNATAKSIAALGTRGATHQAAEISSKKTVPPVPTRPGTSGRVTLTTGPDARNTGVPAGTKLTDVYGDQTISTNGAVIKDENIHGFVFIMADNVTIEDSVIQGRAVAASAADIALVLNMHGHTGLVVKDSELYAAEPSYHIKGIVASNVQVIRDNIHDVTDDVHIIGSNVIVEGTWTHANLHYANDPDNGNGPTHDDSIQVQAGTNLLFQGNRFEGAHNSVMQITQADGTVGNVRFLDNYADGGNCSLNILHLAGGPVQGIVVDDNEFGTDTGFKTCAVVTVADNASAVKVSGNTFVNGDVANLRVFCADLLHLCQ